MQGGFKGKLLADEMIEEKYHFAPGFSLYGFLSTLPARQDRQFL